MRKKYLGYLSLFILLAFVFLFSKFNDYGLAKDLEELEPYAIFYDENNNVMEPSEYSVKKPYIKFYDENNRLVDSYSQEQIVNLSVDLNRFFNEFQKNNEEPYVNFYNEKGDLINPSADIKKEIKGLKNDDEIYVFGRSNFLNSIEVGVNSSYYKPKNIIVVPAARVESMSITIVDSKGKNIRKIEVGNLVNGINIPLDNYVKEDFYSIEFLNNSNREISLLGGIVIYESE